MQNFLKIWSLRKLSLKGKIVIINSLIVSLFVYPMTNIDVPKNVLEEIDKSIFNFLWSNKPPKIAKKVIQSKISEGGLKMPNIYQKLSSWRLMWIKRAIANKDQAWVKILDAILHTISFTDVFRSSCIKTLEITKKLPAFYQNICQTWSEVQVSLCETMPDVKKQMIWHNKHITIKNSPFFWKTWYEKGIIEIGDLLDNNNMFLSSEQIENK